MEPIQLQIDDRGKGAFVIEENGERLAEMSFSLTGDKMIIAHTEVMEKLAGQGVGLKLIDNMAAYVREHQYKVIPLCPFVNHVFKKKPEKYEDIWQK